MPTGTVTKSHSPDPGRKLYAAMGRQLNLLMARHRVTLMDAGLPLVRPDDDAAIISSVPTIHVDADTAGLSVRRRRLSFRAGGKTAIILARRRPLPVHLKDRACVITKARLRSGRQVPVSCLDLESRTLHLLVDLATALPVAPPGAETAKLLVDSLYGDAMGELLRRRQPPRVGKHVARTALHLLGSLNGSARTAQEKELRMLKRLLERERIPISFRRRVERMEQWLQENPVKAQMDLPVPPATDGEGSRLTQLVASRACGYIHVSPGEITGLANPRMMDGFVMHPSLFRLRLPSPGEPMSLDLWDPRFPEPRKARACLGQAALVFLQFQKAQDLYGTVDFVLGFLETNGIGLFTAEGKPARGSRWMVMGDLF